MFSLVFSQLIEVGNDDIDFLGHASNLSYLRWVQEAAIAHSAAVGLDYEAYKKLGGVFFIRRHEIDYLRPALRGDKLEVRTWVDSAVAAKTLRLSEIIRVEDGKMLAKASTTWGFVNTSGRPVRIPQVVRIAFTKPDDQVGAPQIAEAVEAEAHAAEPRDD